MPSTNFIVSKLNNGKTTDFVHTPCILFYTNLETDAYWEVWQTPWESNLAKTRSDSVGSLGPCSQTRWCAGSWDCTCKTGTRRCYESSQESALYSTEHHYDTQVQFAHGGFAKPASQCWHSLRMLHDKISYNFNCMKEYYARTVMCQFFGQMVVVRLIIS